MTQDLVTPKGPPRAQPRLNQFLWEILGPAWALKTRVGGPPRIRLLKKHVFLKSSKQDCFYNVLALTHTPNSISRTPLGPLLDTPISRTLPPGPPRNIQETLHVPPGPPRMLPMAHKDV